MGSYYSILKFVNNAISGENISLGLISISGDQVFFKYSKSKLAIANKLNSEAKKLLSFNLNKLEEFLSFELKDQSDKLIQFDKSIDLDFLNRLSNYNNGLIQFSQPSFIKTSVTADVFNAFFIQFINGMDEVKEKLIEIPSLKNNISKGLYEPLKGKIDVDYTLKKEKFPSLFFDFHFDSLGANGALYGSKSIDFNTKKVNQIRYEMAEYESVIERMKRFATSKSINGDHKFHIITDAYSGNSTSYNELYSMLENKEIMPYFELIDSKNLNKIVKIVENKNASKFSDLFEA